MAKKWRNNRRKTAGKFTTPRSICYYTIQPNMIDSFGFQK